MNKHQLKITTTQRNKFTQALDKLRSNKSQANIHPILQKAQEEALKSQLLELDEQIKRLLV